MATADSRAGQSTRAPVPALPNTISCAGAMFRKLWVACNLIIRALVCNNRATAPEANKPLSLLN
jgi:hypothetical protein